jgi:CheY-like chemotaxis protein
MMSKVITEDAMTLVKSSGPWKILVVDDDRDIHALTGIIFGDLVHNGNGIQFLYADSVESALHVMDDMQSSISIVLLDMVMGERDAGLRVLEHVRRISKNYKTRFIIRTSVEETQPSEALVKELDIDYCLLKSALTVPDFRHVLQATLQRYQTMSVERRDESEFLLKIIKDLESLNQAHLSSLGEEKVDEILVSIREHLNSVLG